MGACVEGREGLERPRVALPAAQALIPPGALGNRGPGRGARIRPRPGRTEHGLAWRTGAGGKIWTRPLPF